MKAMKKRVYVIEYDIQINAFSTENPPEFDSLTIYV